MKKTYWIRLIPVFTLLFASANLLPPAANVFAQSAPNCSSTAYNDSNGSISVALNSSDFTGNQSSDLPMVALGTDGNIHSDGNPSVTQSYSGGVWTITFTKASLQGVAPGDLPYTTWYGGRKACIPNSSSNTNGTISYNPSGSTGAPSSPVDTKKKDECEGKTGTARTSCQEKVKCEAKTKQGYVFARAFNNACVTLPDFVQTLINYVMLFSSVIAGFMLLQGGFKVVASRGNPTSLVEARGTILNAVIGLVLLATAYVIIQFLNGMFGSGVTPDINLLGPFVP